MVHNGSLDSAKGKYLVFTQPFFNFQLMGIKYYPNCCVYQLFTPFELFTPFQPLNYSPTGFIILQL